MFINRNEELEVLRERGESPGSEFIVIYGRRRVGKTELIKRFLLGKRGIYFLAFQQSEQDQLSRLSSQVAAEFKDEFLMKNRFSNWDAVFSYIAEKGRREPLFFVIDEFPYLVESNPSIPSLLQGNWDEFLRHTTLKLILCGSSLSMMEEKVLGYKTPLYGRRTAQMLIKPFKFMDAQLFLPRYTIENRIEAYAILGGTPAYLLQFSDRESLLTNINHRILRTDSYLFEDVIFVLREELRQPRYYFSIIAAISQGKTTLGEIMNHTGISRNIVAKYLSVLTSLRLVRRDVPVTEKHPYKSRKGIYIIQDNFFRFWFRFIFPNIDVLELGKTDLVLAEIEENLSSFTSKTFEDVAKEVLIELSHRGELPFAIHKIGRWWFKEHEVDIVAFDSEKRNMLFAECKWTKRRMSNKDLSILQEKASLVSLRVKSQDARIYYALFSKRGFSGLPEKENLLKFDLREIERILPLR